MTIHSGISILEGDFFSLWNQLLFINQINIWIYEYSIMLIFEYISIFTAIFYMFISDLWFQRLPTTFQGSNAISELEWKLTSLQWCRSEQLKQWVLEKTELHGDKCEPTKNESCVVEGRSKELQTKRISDGVPEKYFALSRFASKAHLGCGRFVSSLSPT